MRKLLLIALILVSVVVAGCTGSAPATDNTKTFVGGTEGVVIRFEESAPPIDIISGEGFDVVAVLTNRGEFPVDQGSYRLFLKGFSPRDFDTTPGDLNITPFGDQYVLEPADINPDTGETIDPYDVYVSIPEDGLTYVGGVTGNMEYPMVLEICYPYQTEAYGKLCIKRNLRDSTDDDTCIISGPKDMTSSGAPIGVRNLEEYSGGSERIRFSFEVYDANPSADIYSPLSDCAEGYQTENQVYVNVNTGFEGSLLSCNGLGDSTNGEVGNTIKLNSGVRKITCSQEIPSNQRGDYVKTVHIYTTYDVGQRLSKTLLVKNVDE